MNGDTEKIQRSEIQEDRKCFVTPFFKQLIVIISPLSLVLSAGVGLGTATVMIPQIKANNSGIHLEKDMESWLYSIQGFAAVPSVLTIPYLTQVKGYKFSFRLICFPIIISYFVQYSATSAVHLLIATLLQGLTMGGNLTLSIIIVSEFSDPKYRGTFLVMKGASYFWGMWISNAVGTFSSWRNIPLVGIWPSVLALVISFIWPESPYWLASKGRIEECQESFRWLRGGGQEAENELTLLTTAKDKTHTQSKDFLSSLQTTVFLRQFYMPIFLNTTMFFLYHSCGKIVFQTYVLVIIKDITKNDSVAYTGMLIIDGVTVFGMYLGSYVAMKVQRRSMYIYTTITTIFFLYLFSFYLFLVQFNVLTSNNTTSLCLLILYSFSVCWGPMILSTTIYSEITPMRFKPFITSVTVSLMFIMQSGFLKLAPSIFNGVGTSGAFAVYGTLAMFPLLILWKYLPETSNRTLEEIELIFRKKKYCDDGSNLHEGEEMMRYT